MVEHFELNEKGRDFVVGDIHGCFEKLQELLHEMGFFPDTDRLFCVGDLVDRGPNSLDALKWLKKPWFHTIRGNHEQMAIDATRWAVDNNIYLLNGGAWFFRLDSNQKDEVAYQFEKLPIALDVKTPDGLVGIIHGDAPADWNDVNIFPEQNAMWGRDRIRRSDITPVKNVDHVYVGHTPLKKPVTLGNVHYIDTGACFKEGYFTIVCINSGPRNLDSQQGESV